jgi:hypothetical protein
VAFGNETYKINLKLKKNEDSVEIGIDYEHQKAKDYLTQELNALLNNNQNDCIQTFLQGLNQQNPLTIPF